MKQLLLIVNPCAGQRKGKKYLQDIIEIFNRGDFAVLCHVTAARGDAEAAALRYASQVELVVCCGGDGTFSETLSGVLKSGRALSIGYIPAGSTNDLATSLGLSSDILQAARDIVEGRPQPLDVGLFRDRYFSYIASFGVFTRASYATSQSMKNAIGHAAYMLSGIQELSQLRSHQVRVELPDGRVFEDRFLFGAFCNSTSIAGVLTLDANRVDMTDGQLEMLLIRTPKDLFELSECVRALQQKTYNCAMLTFLKTTGARIFTEEALHWTLDGEQENGGSQTEIRCLPQAVQVIRK